MALDVRDKGQPACPARVLVHTGLSVAFPEVPYCRSDVPHVYFAAIVDIVVWVVPRILAVDAQRACSSCSLDLRSARGLSEMYYPEKYLTNTCVSPMMLSVRRTNLLAKRQKGHESSKKAHVYRHPVADPNRSEPLCKFQKKVEC